MVYESNLYHHGIKGQKWGVRRYQNPDGTLTAAGKKRVSKQYEKAAVRANNKLQKTWSKKYLDSYNEVADYMNREGIHKFNESQKKKYGNEYAKRDEYETDYFAEFEKLMTSTLNKKLNEFYATDADVKKARELVKKYNMTSWNELAKNNEAAIEDVRRTVEGY